jgi:hypothetical protein
MRFIVGPSPRDLRQNLEALIALAIEDPDIEMLEQRGDRDNPKLLVLDMPEEKAERLRGLFPALIIEEDLPLEPFGSNSSLHDGRAPFPKTDSDSREG